MKTTTTIGKAKAVTTYNGHELTEAVLVGTGKQIDAYKKSSGTWAVTLERNNNSLEAEAVKVLRRYEMNQKDFFAYWDKKLNEWK